MSSINSKQGGDNNESSQRKDQTISTLIADVICDPSL